MYSLLIMINISTVLSSVLKGLYVHLLPISLKSAWLYCTQRGVEIHPYILLHLIIYKRSEEPKYLRR